MKHLQSYGALFALVAAIVSALNYFPSNRDFTALAAQVQQNSDELEYQTVLRTYEFLLNQSLKNPEDSDLKRRLMETEVRLKGLEKKLFQNKEE